MSEHTYELIARQLREELGPAGSLIPTEAALMQRYGAARGTIRQALTRLENEGLISASQGSRRTVRDVRRWCWPMHTWEQHHSATADAWANSITAQGGIPESDVRVSIVLAPEDVRKSLNIPEGEPVIVRARIRKVDGEPHQLSDSYFPRWLTDEHPEFLQPGDISRPGGLLAAAGLTQVRFYDQITARMPDSDEARTLRMSSGTPLLIHSRTGYDEKDRPVRHMITRAAADRVEISYALDA